MVLVTGVAGQLGYDVVRELNKRHIECIGVDRTNFDITDSVATEQFIKKVMPTAVIHCASYTAVDAAEDNVELCRKVNVEGTANIAKVCKEIGAKMLYISTDYVFGDSPALFRKEGGPQSGGSFLSLIPQSSFADIQVPNSGFQTIPPSLRPALYALRSDNIRPHEVNDECCPLNVYGKSKLDGELVVKSILDKYFIVRTSWGFGHHGKNFVETMLCLGKENESLNVVADQIGSPTFTEDLAEILADMIVTDKYGTYHATNEGICSWAEFAAEIMRLADLPCKINPVSTEEYYASTAEGRGASGAGGRVVTRPLNSRLSKKSLDEAGFRRLSEWQDALERYFRRKQLK